MPFRLQFLLCGSNLVGGITALRQLTHHDAECGQEDFDTMSIRLHSASARPNCPAPLRMGRRNPRSGESVGYSREGCRISSPASTAPQPLLRSSPVADTPARGQTWKHQEAPDEIFPDMAAQSSHFFAPLFALQH
jgi:hypothetical protein